MRTVWVSYPDSGDTFTSLKVLIPAPSAKPIDIKNSSFMSVGGRSSIGNRRCFHLKLDFDVIPLDVKYNVRPYKNLQKYYLLYQADNLPFPYWTALLSNVDQTLARLINYGEHRDEYYITVADMGPGVVTTVQETRTIFTYTPERNSISIRTIKFTARDDFNQWCDVDVTVRMYQYGTWTEYSFRQACQSGPVEVDTISALPDARVFWRAHGKEIANRFATIPTLDSWGDLADQCAQKGDKAYQVSSAMYLLELNQLTTLLSPYIGIIRGGLSAKKAASAWLSYYYGARLTVKDTYAQVSGIVRNSGRKIMDISKLNARALDSKTLPDGSTISSYRALTVYYRTHSSWLLDTYHALRRYGLNPSLSLAWDLVPLSFVVDWLSPIGDALAHFDGKTFSESLMIEESILTEKYVMKSDAAHFGYPNLSGSITVTLYDRKIQPGGMPKPTFAFDPISFSGTKALNGLSLVVQRRN